ncbi:MAG TPA: guanine deaminase [Casimicrobiaceae bacterium]|nr:guanine deaminase [Casimicrobiaceae bacterium]
MATRAKNRAAAAPAKRRLALRGPVLTYAGDPLRHGFRDTMRYEADAIVAIEDGRIAAFGAAAEIAATLEPRTRIERYGEDSLIMAGFVDCHVHYPQVQIIGAGGEQLLDWLDKYTFPAEQRFDDSEHARETARFFFGECLRNGITSSAVYCTVHASSVDALFEEALLLGSRTIAGKLLMDRNAPSHLLDTARTGYDESKELIDRWHGRDRLLYAITPRFAVTSSPSQLAAAGALKAEHPDCFVQSHVAENRREVEWVRELYPDRRHYLDVYDHYGLLGERAIYGHGIWLSEEELRRCQETGTAIAHCPTSNFFLGSGCFDLRAALDRERPLRVGLASDLGAGTSFSMLQTLSAAYKTAQLHGYTLRAAHAFYLATRGTARALYLDDAIGSIAPGMEADLVVLDLKSTPLIEYRMRHAADLEEALFVQMTLGDDRAVRATYVAGRKVYARDEAPERRSAPRAKPRRR